MDRKTHSHTLIHPPTPYRHPHTCHLINEGTPVQSTFASITDTHTSKKLSPDAVVHTESFPGFRSWHGYVGMVPAYFPNIQSASMSSRRNGW